MNQNTVSYTLESYLISIKINIMPWHHDDSKHERHGSVVVACCRVFSHDNLI